MPMHINYFVAPVPYAAEIAGAMQAAPQAQAEMSRQLAFDKLVLDRQKVPAVEEKQGVNALSKDGRQGGQQLLQHGRHRKHGPLEPVELHAHAEGVWQGIIININV